MQINIPILINVVVVQVLSCVQLFEIPWTAACQASLSVTNSQNLLKPMFIESVMPSNHLILCHPLLLPPSSFPASVFFPMSRIFTSVGQSIVASASALVLPMSTQDWSPLRWIGWISLQSKGLWRVFSTQQFKSTNSLALRFFIVQLPHPYMTTGKTIALTRWTSVGKVMSLLFNMLSRLVVAFLPRSKCLLISWVQVPTSGILEPPKIRSLIVSPSICHEMMAPDAMILVFWMLSFKPYLNLS